LRPDAAKRAAVQGQSFELLDDFGRDRNAVFREVVEQLVEFCSCSRRDQFGLVEEDPSLDVVEPRLVTQVGGADVCPEASPPDHLRVKVPLHEADLGS